MRSFFDPYPLNSGRLATAPEFADHVEDVVLAPDTLQRVAIPAGARFAIFSFSGDIRAKPGGAATTFSLPSTTSGDGAGSELNPAARRLPSFLSDGATPATHLLLRASSAVTGSIAFYA